MSAFEIPRGRAWAARVRLFTDKSKTNTSPFAEGVLKCEIRDSKSTSGQLLAVVAVDDSSRDVGHVDLNLTDAQVSAVSATVAAGWLDIKRTVNGEDFVVVPPVRVVFVGSVTE